MYIYNLHRAFKIELDKSGDISSYPSFLPEEIDYWLNRYVARYIKTRYSGNNPSRASFQENQKRSDDFRTITKTNTVTTSYEAYSPGHTYQIGSLVTYRGRLYECIELVDAGSSFDYTKWITKSEYKIQYPSDYWIGVGEYSFISYGESIGNDSYMWTDNNRTDIIECTIENIDSRLNSTLSDHRLHNGFAKPLRLYSNGNIYLYTDGSYMIKKYTMEYICKPEEINFYKFNKFNETISYAIGDFVRYNGIEYKCTAPHTGAFDSSHFEEYPVTIMPDHLWDEIVTGAVRLALENISEQRYQTYSQESIMTE